MIRIFAAVLYALLVLPGLAAAQSAEDVADLHAFLQTLPADPVAAVALYRAAAEQGFAPAIHNLGSAYEDGTGGLVADDAMARAWYWKAAAQDYGPSLGNLGIMLRDGRGGPKDQETGLAVMERAAAVGDPAGTAQLAYMLATGDGAVIDLPRARELYALAAAQNIDWAMRDYGEWSGPRVGLPICRARWRSISARRGRAMQWRGLTSQNWSGPIPPLSPTRPRR